MTPGQRYIAADGEWREALAIVFCRAEAVRALGWLCILAALDAALRLGIVAAAMEAAPL